MKRHYLLLGAALFVAPICDAADVANCTSPLVVAGQNAAREGKCAADTPLPTPAIAGALTGEDEIQASDAPTPGPSAGPYPPLMAPRAHLPSTPSMPMSGPAPPSITPAASPAVYSRKDKLQTGMSDLQVLNNRRWGKPQRITRNRDARAWHEQWSYETGANGGKQLHFINGMLASVDDLVPMGPRPQLAE